MSPATFDDLLSQIEVAIYKQDTRMRKAISPRHRLMATLRYLTSGADFQLIGEVPRISPSTLCRIIPEVCSAIYKIVGPQVIHLPTTSEEWREVAKDYEEMWNYPQCLGSLDGKHVRIKAPARSGTVCHNFKGYFSTLLFALVDAKHSFRFVDVGAQGASNDSGVYQRSKLNKMRQEGLLNVPDMTIGDEPDIQFHWIGDTAFAMSDRLFTPFSQEAIANNEVKATYNYRHSRARRIVESTFGILCHRFKIMFGSIEQDYESCIKTIQCCVTLHNYLNFKEGINKEEHQAGEEAANDHDDEEAANNERALAAVGPLQNPDEHAQRQRLAEWFMTKSGKIKEFD